MRHRLTHVARFQQQPNQQRVRRFIQLIHLQPAASRGDAIGNVSRGQRILPQFIIGGDHLAVDMFACDQHPVVELWGIGQVETSQKVTLVALQRLLQEGRCFG